ncbi:MAG: cbb3-type cytochrome oxidase assembly protein CcoS [Bacteroidota bacterium]
MSVIFILIGCSLLLASSFLIAFLWASKTGQFEDDYTPSVRMLFNDGTVTKSKGDRIETKKKSSIKPNFHVRK